MGQLAIRWLLAEPSMASVLPNIYDEWQLREFAAASDKPALTAADLTAIAHLYEHDFDLQPEEVRS